MSDTAEPVAVHGTALAAAAGRGLHMLDDGEPKILEDVHAIALTGSLSSAGFKSDEPAVVSWLGVTQYLTSDAISDTLQWVARLPSDSEIVLTFAVPCPQADAIKKLTKRRGVRFETFFEPDEMQALLVECGLSGETLTPSRIDEMFYRDRDDGLHAHTWEWLAVGRAQFS